MISALENEQTKDEFVLKIEIEKGKLVNDLLELSIIEKIFPSDSNMLLVRFKEAKKVFEYLLENKIIIRDRTNVALCDNCLRITVGTLEENTTLINALKKY